MNSRDYDIVILGAGFAGLATARALLGERPKLRLLVLEREAKPGLHASGRNAGLIRQGVAPPQLARWAQRTAQTLRGLKFSAFRATGSLLLGSLATLQPLQANLKQLGIPALLERRGMALPGFRAKLRSLIDGGAYEAWLFNPSDGVVEPRLWLDWIRRDCLKRGAELLCSVPDFRISFKEGVWSLRGEGLDVSARHLVNAAGAWATGLQIGSEALETVLEPRRRHLFIAQADFNGAVEDAYVWHLDAGYYFRWTPEGWMLCPGDESPHPPGIPEVDPELWPRFSKRLREAHPGFGELSLIRSWACLRTCAPEGNFRVGWDERWQQLFWVAGLGGHGLSASVGLGEEAARQILVRV